MWLHQFNNIKIDKTKQKKHHVFFTLSIGLEIAKLHFIFGLFDYYREKKEKEEEKEDTTPAPRVLKGVMRVGVLAKGLLLHNDLNVHLVVLCAEKPTRTLLERVASGLPKHLNVRLKYFKLFLLLSAT